MARTLRTLRHWLLRLEDKTYFELDKYNEVFIFDGKDMLAKVKSKC